MRKTIFLMTFLLTAILALSIPGKTSAQTMSPVPSVSVSPTPNPETAGKSFVCLDAVRCDNKDANCVPLQNGVYRPVHTAKLSAATKSSKPQANSDVYIFECFPGTPQHPEQICTSGNADIDAKFMKAGDLAFIQKSRESGGYSYQYQGFYQPDGKTVINQSVNPVHSSSNGSIPAVEWQSQTIGLERKFIGLSILKTQAGSGDSTAQQLKTFDLASVVAECKGVTWDPMGIVYDSKSLEPIPNAVVGLQTCRDDKGKMIDSTQMNSSDATARCKSSTTNPYTLLTNNDLLGADLTNPQTTKDDGYFSFIVPDGFYKLTVSQANYTFPDTNGGNSTQNGGKFPYSDIYPAKTGEVIVQQGAIQHRDIPMTPKTGTGINYPIKIVTKYQDVLQKNNITQIVDGKVSHPYAYINICSVGTPSSKPIDTIQADARGYFKKAVDVSTVNIAQYPLRLVPKKNNDPDARSCPTALSFVEWLKSFITVNAQEDDALTRMDPILNNIEGYAYDSAGNKLVNTKVDIYVSFSSKPYYSTTTDANGYYKISSENLPSFQYSIKYTTKTGTVSTVTTSDFIAKNKEYIQKNNTDLMAYKDNQGNVLVSSGSTGGKASGNKPTIPFATVQPGQNTGDATGNGGNQSNATTTNNGGDNYLLILSLMVILLLAVAGGLVFYMQKKKAAKPPQR